MALSMLCPPAHTLISLWPHSAGLTGHARNQVYKYFGLHIPCYPPRAVVVGRFVVLTPRFRQRAYSALNHSPSKVGRRSSTMPAQDPTVSTENNGSALLTTACATLTLTWLSVCLRTYVRIFLTKQFLLDDWLMLAAQVYRSRHGLDFYTRDMLMIDDCDCS